MDNPGVQHFSFPVYNTFRRPHNLLHRMKAEEQTHLAGAMTTSKPSRLAEDIGQCSFGAPPISTYADDERASCVALAARPKSIRGGPLERTAGQLRAGCGGLLI